MSYTMVILYCSTVISAVSGALFWNEQIQTAHVIGIVLMLVSFVLAVKKQPGEKSVSLRWLLLSLGAFATTGGIGVMQKLHQSTQYKLELNEFLVIAFGTATLLSALYLVILGAKKQLKPPQQTVKVQWLLLAIMVLSGVSGALCNQWNLYLSGVMDSAVFFPMVNGGGLVLTTLAAVVIFKEKLSGQQWLGVVFGIASVIFLCNPF
jgi:drug/metabolite transporter (DMT)-like permease